MNKGKKWTEDQETELRSYYSSNETIATIADKMGRTSGSILARLEHLGLIDSPYNKTPTPSPSPSLNSSITAALQKLAVDSGQSVECILKYIRTGYTVPAPAVEPKVAQPLKPPPARPPPLTELPPLTEEQGMAYNLFLEGKSMCLTRPAGTGKSHILKHIPKYCVDHHIEFAITATTGAAACLVAGQTLHKWTGLGLITDKSITECVAFISRTESLANRWRNTQVLVIDEISMMWAELFEHLNRVAQAVRGNKLFFGGLQVIFCGDFAQLPPVKQSHYAFESSLWADNLSNSTVYLKQVMRQDDPEFIKMLSELRLARPGKLSAATQQRLNARVNPDLGSAIEDATDHVLVGDELIDIEPTILYPHRESVDKLNQRELDKLRESGCQTMVYEALDTKYGKDGGKSRIDRSDTKTLDERSPVRLELAIGALVMLTINLDVKAGLVNGARGRVMSFENGLPVVQFANGQQTTVKQFEFESNISDGYVSRRQMPLILAWALTIHKCQGATLDGVVTDLRGAFCESQSYVTLSRVRSIDNLHLIGIDYSKIACNAKVLKYYNLLDQGRTYEATQTFLAEDEPDVNVCML